MSISLKEIFTSCGYDMEDLEDLKRVQNILYDAEDLQEEIDAKIYDIENINQDEEREHILADYAYHEAQEEW